MLFNCGLNQERFPVQVSCHQYILPHFVWLTSPPKQKPSQQLFSQSHCPVVSAREITHCELNPVWQIGNFLCRKFFGFTLCFPRVNTELLIFLFFFYFFFIFCLFRAMPTANGSPQARGQIGAIAASLHHSQSDSGSEPHLQPHHSSRQHRIPNPLSEARNQTQVLMVTNQVRYHWATTKTQAF